MSSAERVADDRFGLWPLALTARHAARWQSWVLVLVLLLPAQARGEEPLILAVHPYLPYAELMQRYSPLGDYLGEALERSVVVRIGRNYQEHIDHIGRNRVDIAFMGPAPYVKLVDDYGGKPLLVRLEIRGRPVFQGKIIVRRQAPLVGLQDLKGKRFAFGDPASTMSHLVPRFMLWKAGVTGEELAEYQFLNSHTNVALGVLAGDFDAGAVKEEVFHKFEPQGLIAIATTPAISEHVLVASTTMTQETVHTARQALFRLRDSARGRAIMKGIKSTMTGMVPARDSDYDNLREILEALTQLGIQW